MDLVHGRAVDVEAVERVGVSAHRLVYAIIQIAGHFSDQGLNPLTEHRGLFDHSLGFQPNDLGLILLRGTCVYFWSGFTVGDKKIKPFRSGECGLPILSRDDEDHTLVFSFTGDLVDNAKGSGDLRFLPRLEDKGLPAHLALGVPTIAFDKIDCVVGFRLVVFPFGFGIT